MFVAAGTLFIIYAAPGDQATMAGRYEVSPEGCTQSQSVFACESAQHVYPMAKVLVFALCL